MVLMFSGEYLLNSLASLYAIAFQLMNVPLFSVSGAGVSLVHVLIFGVGIGLVIKLLVIIFGGSPGEVEVYHDYEG